MADEALNSMVQEYARLRRLLDSGQMAPAQFQAAVQRLAVQDARGVWWTVDPSSGSLLQYTASGWALAAPPGAKKGERVTISPDGRLVWPQTRRFSIIAILVMVGMPLLSAFIWWAYTALPASSEGGDCLTPLIIGGVPLLLLAFRRPIDQLLLPLHRVLRRIPGLMVWLVAGGVPLAVGVVCSTSITSGYGVMRLSTLFGMLFSYVLLRRPEVER